jgi:hypothetical protein
VLTALRTSAPAKPGGPGRRSKPRAARLERAAQRHETSATETRRPLRISDRRDCTTTTRRLRNRAAAVSALLVAVAGTTFAVIDAGGGSTAPGNPVSDKPAVAKQAHLTIDQQLQQLASGVRRVAAKRP